MENDLFNRRNWLKAGLGLAAGSAFSGFSFSPRNPADDCKHTPKQEFGPFPVMKKRSQADHDIDLTKVEGQPGIAAGDIIFVKGKIHDELCNPISGAIVEIWQTNHFGKYHHEYQLEPKEDPNFQGWGQAITAADGSYQFKTIIPSAYARRTRHIHFKVSRRGFHDMITQLYFEGEPLNEKDGILNSLSHEDQQQVVRTLNKSGAIPVVDFHLMLEAVKEGAVPAKVLAEYNGKYKMLVDDDSMLKGLLKNNIKGNFSDLTVEFFNEGDQFFFSMPFTPKTELTWKSKDRFDATYFYRCDLVFLRGTDGKVNKMQFLFIKGGVFVEGDKIS
ncbi:MAG TPA: protocatechuate 3,4-dioxygenase [Chitinophagaceae bacterium]|jgi:protocatechuate 3,4-dioxygenase, beta subunit|nr:protocatechuate 3,4-dioxygenase [Chitinophagaceae bacterium]